MTEGTHLVVLNDGGKLVLATRRAFPNEAEAQRYADGVASCYTARVVETLPVLVGRPGEDSK